MMSTFKGQPQSKIDMSSRYRRRQAVQNIVAVANHADPAAREEASHWYEKVNEAMAKGIKGTSTDMIHGAGLVAAVSPNMDWEKRNIDALGELHSIKSGQWADIHKGDMSSLQGKSIHSASRDNLVKAHRILQGEHPDLVLPRQSAPKTNSFAHNIAEPDVSNHVTIDGRAHDIAANRLQGWGDNRGIGSAGLKSGKTTRYEHFEQAYHSAANVLNDQHGTAYRPHEVQAITWEHGKSVERSGTTKAGKPRQQGPARKGQPYVGPGGLLQGP